MDSFAAVSDPTRRAIVERLAEGPLPAGAIASGFAISAPAVSQHLKALREGGIVTVEKRGTQRIYSLNPDGLAEAERWIARTRAIWARRLDRLERLLEEEEDGK